MLLREDYTKKGCQVKKYFCLLELKISANNEPASIGKISKVNLTISEMTYYL